MNDRLEIASRLMANFQHVPNARELALAEADALIAEEARTRPNSSISSNSCPAPDDLRAVAEELTRAVEVVQARLDPALVGSDYRAQMKRLGCRDNEHPHNFADRTLEAALALARAMGLGGGE